MWNINDNNYDIIRAIFEFSSRIPKICIFQFLLGQSVIGGFSSGIRIRLLAKNRIGDSVPPTKGDFLSFYYMIILQAFFFVVILLVTDVALMS